MTKLKYNNIIKSIDIKKELEKKNISGEIDIRGDLMFCCLFHDESNPSMGIRLEGRKKGLWNCFSCGEAGNFISLISRLDNISYEEAFNIYANKINKVVNPSKLKEKMIKRLKEKNKEQKEIQKDEKPKYINKKILKKFKKPYGEYLRYLIKKRKLTKHTIKKFGILCCDDNYLGWDKRVVIPILDENDKLISLTARYAGKCEKKDRIRKVTDSDVAKVVYGLKWIENKDILVLVEGEISMIYLQQFGIPAVMSGKLPKNYRLRKIVRCCEKAYLCLDATEDVTKELIKKVYKRLSKFIPVEIIKLPRGKDPNDLTEEEVKKYFYMFF